MSPANLLLRAALALAIVALGAGTWLLAGRLSLARARRSSGKESLLEPGRAGLLLFGSAHCAPCVQAQAPAARRLEAELGGRLQLREVDVDEEPELAERYGVMSLPTVYIYDAEGEPRRVFRGLVSLDELRRQVQPFLAS